MIRPGQPVPDLSFPLVHGASWNVHEARKDDRYLLIEIYRGHHCGVCRTHLRQLVAMHDDFARYGASVVAVSMNDRSSAKRSVAEWELGDMAVGYGLDEATARRWGLYLSERYRESEPPIFAEPATFLVQNDGVLYSADVRSSPHLRPQLDRVITMVRRAGEGYPPRGTA